MRTTSNRLLIPVLFVLTCTALAGCTSASVGAVSTVPTDTADRLETLQLPGVKEVTPVYELLDRKHSPSVDLVGSLVLPGQDGSVTPYLAFANSHNLYAIRPDGADLHVIYTDVPCDLPTYSAGFSPDSQWFACVDANTLWMAHLSSAGKSTPWLRLAVAPTDINHNLSWSPDGQQLIVTSFRTPCVAYIYQVSTTHDSAQLVKSLTFPSLSQQAICNLMWAGWSPDGQYLAVSHVETGAPTYYVIALAQLSIPASGGAAPVVVTVLAESLKRVGRFSGQSPSAAVWSSTTDTFLVNKDLRTILEVPMSGEPQKETLTVPIAHSSAHLCAVGAIAKSRLIAFTYCFHQIPDLPRPISGPGERLFVFDPSIAQ